MQPVIFKRQLKAARSLLDWSQKHLADVSCVSLSTIRRLEEGKIKTNKSTISLIIKTLENNGITFSGGVTSDCIGVSIHTNALLDIDTNNTN